MKLFSMHQWLRACPAAALLCVCACASEEPPILGPALSVERWDSAQSCFAACPEHSPDRSVVSLPNRCAQAAPDCAFNGGEDKIRILADLDPLEIEPQTQLSPPSLLFFFDGQKIPVANPFPPRAPGQDRAYFAGVADIPPTAADSMSLRVDFGSGFGAEAGGFSVLPPTVLLSATDCDQNRCIRQAGVGELVLTVSAPLSLNEPALLQVLLNEFPQVQPASISLQNQSNSRRSGTFSLPIPEDEDAKWVLRAQVGSFAAQDEIAVQITPLSLSVSLPACPLGQNPCGLPASSQTTLIISAPKDVQDINATIVEKIDGIVQPSAGEVELASIEGNTRVGAAKIIVPDAPSSTWQLTVHLGKSAKTTPSVLIAPQMP